MESGSGIRGKNLLPKKFVPQSTESGKKAYMWLGEISSCSCLTFLPGPAWLLLNKICKALFRALYNGNKHYSPADHSSSCCWVPLFAPNLCLSLLSHALSICCGSITISSLSLRSSCEISHPSSDRSIPFNHQRPFAERAND